MISKYMREQLDKVSPPNHVKRIANTAANGAHTLEIYETVVHIANSASYTETLTLPPVAEARGITYSIIIDDDGGHVTVQDQDDATDWSDQVSTADADYLIVQSDGERWNILAADMT